MRAGHMAASAAGPLHPQPSACRMHRAQPPTRCQPPCPPTLLHAPVHFISALTLSTSWHALDFHVSLRPPRSPRATPHARPHVACPHQHRTPNASLTLPPHAPCFLPPSLPPDAQGLTDDVMDSALQHIPLQARADALNALLGASRLQVRRGRGGAGVEQRRSRGGASTKRRWSRSGAAVGQEWGGVGGWGGGKYVRDGAGVGYRLCGLGRMGVQGCRVSIWDVVYVPCTTKAVGNVLHRRVRAVAVAEHAGSRWKWLGPRGAGWWATALAVLGWEVRERAKPMGVQRGQKTGGCREQRYAAVGYWREGRETANT